MSKNVKLILAVLGIIGVGYLRDYLFYNINWIYLTLVNGRMNAAREEFHFLLSWTPGEINVLKFFLTGFFVLLFFLITYLIIRFYFGKKEYQRIVVWTFAVLTAGALLLAGFGKLTGLYNELYGAIHALMTLVQSFIPLVILGLIFAFFPNENKD